MRRRYLAAVLRRVTATVITSSLLLASAVIGGVNARAADGTGTIALQTPSLVVDTRTPPGLRVTELAIGTGYLHLDLFSPTQSGTAAIRSCGTPASDDDVHVGYELEGGSSVNVLRSDPQCIYADTPVHVRVARLGTLSETPEPGRSQFAEMPEWLELFADEVDPGPTSSTFSLGRPPALPADATAAVLSIYAVGTDPGFAAVTACDALPAFVTDIVATSDVPQVVAMPPIDSSDTLCLTVSGGATFVAVDLMGWLSESGSDPDSVPPMYGRMLDEILEPGFVGMNPTRVLDTRNAIGWPDRTKVDARETVELFLEDAGPWSMAASLNVTVTEPEGEGGYLTVWPCEEARPETSTLNFTRYMTRANLTVTLLPWDNTVCLWSTVSTHLIADLTGTYEFGGGAPAHAVEPERILDTRNAIGVPSRVRSPEHFTTMLKVTGRGGVPDEGVEAVTLNLTAVEPLWQGYVTVWPCGADRPEASNLNFMSGGHTVPNLVTVQVGSNGNVCIYTSAPVHLLADVAAWYGDGGTAGFVQLSPDRMLDTRNGIGAPKSKVAKDGVVTLQVTGRSGVRDGATAVVLNVTVTEAEGEGYVTAWPCDQERPVVSNLNFQHGETVANLATVKLSATGTICLSSTGRAHLLADVAGFLTPEPTPAYVVALR